MDDLTAPEKRDPLLNSLIDDAMEQEQLEKKHKQGKPGKSVRFTDQDEVHSYVPSEEVRIAVTRSDRAACDCPSFSTLVCGGMLHAGFGPPSGVFVQHRLQCTGSNMNESQPGHRRETFAIDSAALKLSLSH